MLRPLFVFAATLVVRTIGIKYEHTANPIRKVVTMLQEMQKKVEEEGKAEEELYKKFMCYCKNSGGDLQASIQAAEEKAPQLTSDIESSEAAKAQLDDDVKQATSDRAAAQAAMADATSIREKEAAAYTKASGDLETNIAAINKAVSALEKGAQGPSFLQTPVAATLRKLIASTSRLSEDNRATFISFLSNSYAPSSGEVIGILKELGDQMSADLAEEVATEKSAIGEYDALMAAKKKEIAALTAAIETKMSRSAELGVSIVNMKNDLSDTEASLMADKKFAADLETDCATKTSEWEEISKTRQEELVALAETIKVLNDDDALELFKKTLPSSSSASLLQVPGITHAKAQALAMIERSSGKSNSSHRHQLDAIAAALQGKSNGFEKVVEMIDAMVETLKKEQDDDDAKKEYCHAQFDESDDKKKALERSIADTETAIATTEGSLATVTDEIAVLKKESAELLLDTTKRTDQRKSEHVLYVKTMDENSAAKELLGFAKNRLHKFYNPQLHTTTAAPVLSREDQIYTAFGGEVATTTPGGIADTGVTVLAQLRAKSHRTSDLKRAAPPPAPEAPGPYSKKMEDSAGVIAMIDLLIKDLEKEMTGMQAVEENSQKVYIEFMKDSQDMNAANAKSLTEKSAVKADLEAELQSLKEGKSTTSKELEATAKYIGNLHAECDWMLQHFDTREEARNSEITALGDAKAVLAGADYSLLQTWLARKLRGGI